MKVCVLAISFSLSRWIGNAIHMIVYVYSNLRCDIKCCGNFAYNVYNVPVVISDNWICLFGL